MTIHLKYYPSGSIGICLAVFIGGVGVEGVVGVGGGRGGGCLDPSPAPAPHLYITSH